jgi:hypothetical protein
VLKKKQVTSQYSKNGPKGVKASKWSPTLALVIIREVKEHNLKVPI